jgi:crotonobetainyl-CoA:carnitine CoA-transferase CaiB-like acyl-CoA transferase
MLANPIRFANDPAPAYTGAPQLGEHSRAVLRDVAGYPDDRVDALLAGAVVFEHGGAGSPHASVS